MPNATQNGRSEPASFLQGTRDPSQDAKGMGFAPNFGQFAVPHVLTFQGLSGSFAKAYRANDEAIKHSLDNARFMRNDCTLMECLESRQRCTALLGWHLEPEDETSADQQELCAELTKILARIRRFTEYRRCLLEAIWYGKAGVQHRYGWTTIGSKRRVMPLPEARDEHPGWVPINGDKIVFRYEDGSFDPGRGTIGLLSGALGAHRDFGGPRVQWDVQPTAQGLAAFIPPSLRSIVAVHKHMIEDGAWEDPENAGSIHGVGVRSRIYWAWFQKQEALAFLMEYLERSAGGIEVWEYPAHNPEAKAKTEQAARERLANGRNVVLFPRDESAAGVPYELRFVEPGMAGIETLKDLLERYFGHMVKRYILGQVLSSEAEATGLGSGVAELHFDTLMQIVRYDATNLEETLTHELVTPVKDFNFPAAKRHHVRFVIETESPDSKAKLEAWERAYNMGARLDERAVMELIGAAMPQDGDRVLQRPDMAQQPGAGPGQPGGDGASLVPGGPEQPRGRSQASVPASLVDDAAELADALRDVEVGWREQYARKKASDPAQREFQWITINGTHVKIDSDGTVQSGPDSLRGKSLGNRDRGAPDSVPDSVLREYADVDAAAMNELRERREAERAVPKPSASTGGEAEWESGKELDDGDKVHRESERIAAEVYADEANGFENVSDKDLQRTRTHLARGLNSITHRLATGEIDKKQAAARREGIEHELGLLDSALHRRRTGKSSGPDHLTRAEKIAERSVLDGRSVRDVAREMGMTRAEFEDIADDVDRASAELRDTLGDADELDDAPSSARQRAMEKQRQAESGARRDRYAKGFDESKHPRDDDGKFTDGAGGGKDKGETRDKKAAPSRRENVKAVSGTMRLVHTTNETLPGGVPTTPDASGLVWFMDTNNAYGSYGENAYEFSLDGGDILDMNDPDTIAAYLKKHKSRSKSREMAYAESLGFRAVRRGSEVAMRPASAVKMVADAKRPHHQESAAGPVERSAEARSSGDAPRAAPAAKGAISSKAKADGEKAKAATGEYPWKMSPEEFSRVVGGDAGSSHWEWIRVALGKAPHLVPTDVLRHYVDQMPAARGELRKRLTEGAPADPRMKYAKPTAGSRSFAWNEEDHPRDASGQFAATAEETAKHGEYSDLMRKHGIEPRQLEDWVTQLRAVAKRQGVKPEPSRTDAVESIELDGADVSVTFNADGAERYAKGERQFASTQVNLDDAAYSRTDGDPAGKFRAVAAEVAESDLAADGREDEPHITVLFGLHGSDPRAVAEIVREFGPVSVRFGEVTTFPPNDEHEVLKIDVESDDLRRLHDAIAALPHTDTFPDYRPHLTVAYVKPGAGAKYVGPCPLTGTEAVFDRIVFSDRDRRHVAVPLRGAGLDRHSRLSAAFDAVFRERYERVEAPPASAAETQPAKRSRGGKGGSWKKVGGSSVFVGPDGTIKKGCPGLKGENVADLKNESDESRDQRAARQAHAEAAGLKGHEVTATEARQLGGERRQRQHAEAKRTAKRFGVPVEDVLRNLPDAHALAMENWKAEEGAAKELRRRFGMNAGDAGRVENAYRDHSTIPNFDALAEEAVQEIPELSHMLQWDYRDAAAAIWDIIRGGAKRQPSPHDESVMDAAGRMAADQRRQGGKPQADDDRGDAWEPEQASADAWGPDPWDKGDTSFDPDKFSRRNAGQEAGKYERVPRFEERKHPREGDGKFAPKGGGSGGKTATAKRTDKSPAVKREKRTDKSPEQYVPTVTLSPAKGRALTGKPVRTRLSKQEIGAIGENVVVAYLQSQGLHDARPMNLDRNNFPVDLVQDHKAIEVKAGFAGNGPGARQWRLTIGEPGKAEKAWLATATPEAKAAWNRAKQKAIHARKAKVLADLEKSYGRKVAAATMTCIVNPDTKTVDLYRFDGWHNRIAWGSPEAQKAYVGSFAYQQRKGK